VQQGPEGLEPGRSREAGPVGADTVEAAQEPGEQDGEGSSEVRFDDPGTVRDGHDL
jgi:hypothetical protein